MSSDENRNPWDKINFLQNQETCFMKGSKGILVYKNINLFLLPIFDIEMLKDLGP